jgi:hypothetical protein
MSVSGIRSRRRDHVARDRWPTSNRLGALCGPRRGQSALKEFSIRKFSNAGPAIASASIPVRISTR